MRHSTRRPAPLSRPSPLPNRSAPDGNLQAVAERGLMMGNRGGRLHRDDGTLGRARWRSRAWICCVIEFRGRRRRVMGDGYTEIFFLDEATALAAGHRPCFECRKEEARAFATAWGRARGTAPPRAGEMDRALHLERLGPAAEVAFSGLPPGSMFARSGAFYLRTATGALTWSFGGYAAAPSFDGSEPVWALTPASTRASLSAGYSVGLHPSAG